LVHLFGHILFSSSIIFILFFLKGHPFGRSRKWTCFRLSLILFLIWNLDTMTNHILLRMMMKEDVMIEGFFMRHYVAAPVTPLKLAYYLTSFDHVICVPAMFLLVISLRLFWRDQQVADAGGREGP